MNVSEILKWLEEESDRLTEESLSSADPHKTVNNSFLEGFNYALANVQGLAQPQLNENQEIVLDWLKSRAKGGNSPFAVVQGFRGFNGVPSLEINSLISLSIAEESQVLQVFSQWALEQEAK